MSKDVLEKRLECAKREDDQDKLGSEIAQLEEEISRAENSISISSTKEAESKESESIEVESKEEVSEKELMLNQKRETLNTLIAKYEESQKTRKVIEKDCLGEERFLKGHYEVTSDKVEKLKAKADIDTSDLERESQRSLQSIETRRNQASESGDYKEEIKATEEIGEVKSYTHRTIVEMISVDRDQVGINDKGDIKNANDSIGVDECHNKALAEKSLNYMEKVKEEHQIIKDISALQKEIQTEEGSEDQKERSSKETPFGTLEEATKVLKRLLFGDPNRTESNVQDYADVNTEMPSYTDPED